MDSERAKPCFLQAVFTPPSRRVEWLLWALVLLAAIGIRLYLIWLEPAGIWSKDAASYADSAFHWVHTGEWESDPRRGPVYSVFLAACLKVFGSLHSAIYVQHVLGVVAILLACFCLRLAAGARFAYPVLACSYAYAVYGLPIRFEHMFRNETLLFFFASVALAAWFLTIFRRSPAWLFLAGLAFSLLSLLKNVFVPFPLVVLAGAAWFFWRKERGFALKQVLWFIPALILPVAGVKHLNSLAENPRPPAPQSGILLYGRTAQFTVLDGGKHPEIKEAIREEVLQFKAQDRHHNNTVLQRIVPIIRRKMLAEGKTTVEVNRVCRELAVEAILANKWAYLKRSIHDLYQLQFKIIRKPDVLEPSDIRKTQQTLQAASNKDPLLDVPNYVARLEPATAKGHFKLYNRWNATSWLFLLFPVFLTTLVLPFLVWFAPTGTLRLWWLGVGALWGFTLVLHCTVGRPMNRYMLPVIPIAFCTLSAAILAGWQQGATRFGPNASNKRESY